MVSYVTRCQLPTRKSLNVRTEVKQHERLQSHPTHNNNHFQAELVAKLFTIQQKSQPDDFNDFTKFRFSPNPLRLAPLLPFHFTASARNSVSKRKEPPESQIKQTRYPPFHFPCICRHTCTHRPAGRFSNDNSPSTEKRYKTRFRRC